jgi:hypothetical protein
MLEKSFPAVSPQLFTANGTANGVITIPDTRLFKVKQHIQITGTGLLTLNLEVKEVASINEMTVGPVNGSILATTDVSAYTTAVAAAVGCPAPQKRPTIGADDFERAVYEEEPVVAKRVILVDQYGRPMGGEDNPIVADVDVTVNSVGLFTLPYDSIAAAYPSSTVETYQSYLGGLSGTPVQLITVTYVDATKNVMQSVVRTPTGP